MAERFQFKLLTGADPDQQYADITTKNPLTFYLLNNGKGYLGTVKLFDASGDSITLVQSITDETTSTTEAASAKAIVDYVTSKVNEIEVITSQFFRKVESHTLTQADLDNAAISKPANAAVGDIGLLFTADDNGTDDGDEAFYFISLANYLSSVHTFSDSDTIAVTVGEDNEVTMDVKIHEDEASLKKDEDGLYIDKVDVIDDENPTDKLVTERVLVDYIINSVVPAVDEAVKEALSDVVTYTQEPPQEDT